MVQGYPELHVFPSARDHDDRGINLREYIAAHALPGVIVAAGATGVTPALAARRAVEYADALLHHLYDPDVR